MKNVFITADLPTDFSKDLRLLRVFSEAKIIHATTLQLQRTSPVEILKYLKCHGFELVLTKSKSFYSNFSTDNPKIIFLNGNLTKPMMKSIILHSTEEINHFIKSSNSLLSLGQDTRVIALLELLEQVG